MNRCTDACIGMRTTSARDVDWRVFNLPGGGPINARLTNEAPTCRPMGSQTSKGSVDGV